MHITLSQTQCFLPLTRQPSDGQKWTARRICSLAASLWRLLGSPGYAAHSLIKLDDVPTMQLEYAQGSSASDFSDSDCDVFSEQGFRITIRLSIKTDSSRGLIAGRS